MIWQAYPLSRIAKDLQPGFARQPKAGDTSLPQLRTNNVSSEGRIDLSLIKEVPASKREIERYSLRKGDVLFNNTNSVDLVGKTAFFDLDGGPFLFSNHMTRVRVNEDIADARFIARYLYWTWKTGGFHMMVTRWVNQAAINKTMLGGVTIQLPPLSEQRRIVEILDQADALRKKRAEADAKATRILPALFYKVFGDPATNSRGWDTGTLGDVIIETQYGTSTRANVNGDGLPVLRMNNIDADGYLDLTDLKYVLLPEADQKRYSLTAGDILFNRTNSKELVGKTGLWRGQIEAVPASYLIRVRVDSDRALPEFIWAYMNCPFIKQMLLNMARRAIGMANINAKELRSLPLIIPDMDRQTSFAQHLCGLEQLRDKRKWNAKTIDRLFVTLLHRAFTGYLTAKWREAHMKELLAEMEAQAKAFGSPST